MYFFGLCDLSIQLWVSVMVPFEWANAIIYFKQVKSAKSISRSIYNLEISLIDIHEVHTLIMINNICQVWKTKKNGLVICTQSSHVLKQCQRML